MQNFLKEYDYIWNTGMEGHYTYGFNGKLLKNNLENYLRHFFCDFNEIETPLILEKNILINSGHWGKFRDPIIYTKNGKSLRLDHLIEKYHPSISFSSLNINKIIELLKEIKLDEDQLIMPDTISGISYRDLMMKTMSGNRECGLRPETATATYNNFADMLKLDKSNKLPIKVFQIGKSFRNEISPRNGILRSREFTQAEFQIILLGGDKKNVKPYLSEFFKVNFPSWKDLDNIELNNCILRLCDFIISLNIPPEKIRLRQHENDERAFYALDAWDLEIYLADYGWTEIAGIHDRGSHDLKNIEIEIKIEIDGLRETPHIIEIAIGVDRLIYAILDTLYYHSENDKKKSILKLPHFLSPIKLAILPLVKNSEKIIELAESIYDQLKLRFKCIYMEKQSIGKRYLKSAILGIPYAITIDFDSLNDNMVTIRDRDTESQNRISIDNLKKDLELLLK